MKVGDVVYVYVTHRGEDGRQLMFRYIAPFYEGENEDETITRAVAKATQALTPYEIYTVEVFTVAPRVFDVRHGIEERA